MNKFLCLLATTCFLLSCTKDRTEVPTPGVILPVINPVINPPAPVPPIVQFNRVYGGSYGEIAYCIAAASKGGFIMAGTTNSNDGDVSGARSGGSEVWAVRLDNEGKILWQKVLGGSGDDRAHSVVAAEDGGFVLAGYTASYGGDVTGKHKGDDVWIVKLDQEGKLQWQKTLGGAGDERANSIITTSDGNYIVAGYTTSNDGDVSGRHGGEDVWVIKLDRNGNKLWQKTLGGSKGERALSIAESPEGSYVMAGITSSNDGDVSGIHGLNHTDAWIVKLDKTGSIKWQKTLGGSDADHVSAIKASPDGGYVIAGATYSNDGDVSSSRRGGSDLWVMKIDEEGKIQWQKTFGGSGLENATSVTIAKDGGFLVAGNSDSNNGDLKGSHGTWDVWLLKLNKEGTKQWGKLFGGSDSDFANCVITNQDGSYVMAGYTASNDGDVNGTHGFGIHNGWTDADAWVMGSKEQ